MAAVGVFWWLLCLVGLVQVVVEGGIFEPVRQWVAKRSGFFGYLLHCPLCFGVWAGGWASLVFVSPAASVLPLQAWIGGLPWPALLVLRVVCAVLDGCAVSWAAFTWTTVRRALDRPAVRVASPEPDDDQADNVSPPQPYERLFEPVAPEEETVAREPSPVEATASGCPACPPLPG